MSGRLRFIRWILIDGELHCGSKHRDTVICGRAVSSAEPEIFTELDVEPESLLCAPCRTGIAVARYFDDKFLDALVDLVANSNGVVDEIKRQEIAEYLQSLQDAARGRHGKPRA